MIPTSFDASRSHSSGRNFIFLWGGQVHLFSYSRIESESTTTLVTKATNTRRKQQTFQPLNWNKEIVKSLLYNFSPWTETKKSLNLYFITLGAFHSPSGQGVGWFKEGKIPLENTFTIVTLPLIHLVHHDPLFPISLGKGAGWGELNKMVGVHGQCENGESNRNNLQISTELKKLCLQRKFCSHWSFCMHESAGLGSEVKWGDRQAWNRPLWKIT